MCLSCFLMLVPVGPSTAAPCKYRMGEGVGVAASVLFMKNDMVIEAVSENKHQVQGFISARRQGLACLVLTGLSLPW